MKRQIIYFVLVFLLLADLSFSFVQYLNQSLDGDMAWNLVPANDVKPIFENPFGLHAILNNQTYANPNRFFCHWIFKEYLISTPLLLQKFVEPIDSIYLSCAISKIFIQISLIVLLAMAISGTKNLLKLDFMISAFLIAPLFQANGYRSYMGIIDPSTTYTFFYALPCALLLLYFLPFIFQFYHGEKLSSHLFIKVLWIPLAIVVCLSGPLNPGVILISSILIILYCFADNFIHSNSIGIIERALSTLKKIPGIYWILLLPVCLLSLYSLFLGRYNSISISTQIPLREMYLKLPVGIYYQFTQKLGFPLLFAILAINVIIISKKFKSLEGEKILFIFKWIGIFSLCYILLLPLGGYRNYRPNILRYDTIMPITLSLFFIFGITTLFILKRISNRQKIVYLPLIICTLLIYTNSDEARFDNNKCERSALKKIADSNEKIVQLDNNFSVVAWKMITKPKDSELNAELLNIWNVTKEKKLYFNQ